MSAGVTASVVKGNAQQAKYVLATGRAQTAKYVSEVRPSQMANHGIGIRSLFFLMTYSISSDVM